MPSYPLAYKEWGLEIPDGDCPRYVGVDLKKLHDWQQDRCAGCGFKGGDKLVEDHDHETWLTRAFLCRSCNTHEGVSTSDCWDEYRLNPPTKLLGLRIFYSSSWNPMPGHLRELYAMEGGGST